VEGTAMRPQEEAHVGMTVRVCEDHRISELRGVVGKVVGSYWGTAFMALEVYFPDGRYRQFWPEDLEEIPEAAFQQSWSCSLLGGSSAR